MKKPKGSKPYTLNWVALDKHVLLVELSSGHVNHGVFIGAVKGEDYGMEAQDVVENGSFVSPNFGQIYFKNFGSGPVKLLREAEPYFERESLRTDPARRNPNILELRRVDKHVLLVALKGPDRTWKVLIGAIEGKDYGMEAQDVVENGSEVPYEVAKACFEDIPSDLFRWHRKLRVFFGSKDYGPAEAWGGNKPARPVRKRD